MITILQYHDKPTSRPSFFKSKFRFFVDFQISKPDKKAVFDLKNLRFYPKKPTNVFLIILIYLIILQAL